MPVAEANGIEIAYEGFGPKDREAIVLIMGLGAQLTQWPVELCEALVARGYRVIRFDNRDVGLSTKIEGPRFPRLAAAIDSFLSGHFSLVPYTLSDMADDTLGLLDALGIDRAHFVGASMGGMIAQLIAADRPERILSLTSIMSTTGNPFLPPAKSQAFGLFVTPPPSTRDADAIVAYGIKTYRTIGSPAFPTDEDTLRRWVRRDARRCYYPAGVTRQIAAVMTNGDRRPKLRRIAVPTVVLHGEADPLVPVESARDTAANIPGAELRIVPGMGHDVPLQLVDVFATAIAAAATRATGLKVAAVEAVPMLLPPEPEPDLLLPAPIAAEVAAHLSEMAPEAEASAMRAGFFARMWARVRMWARGR